MLEIFSSYNPFKKVLFALEHSILADEPIIYGLELVQKKGELDIAQMLDVTSPEDLSKLVPKTSQLFLVITDHQILSKQVSNTGTDTEIVTEAFPNLNLNEFYYQILRTTEHSFISVCRIEYVETLIEQYEKANINITSVHLGELKMVSLATYAKNGKFCSNTSEVNYVNGEITSIKTSGGIPKEEYTIEGLALSSKHILPLAVALDYFLGTDKISGNIEFRNLELFKKLRESRFFKNTLQIGIGFLLIVLIINFFAFSTKYKKWQGLQEELQVYSSQRKLIEDKQAGVKTKEALVQSILATGFSRSSNYVNQIMQELPNTVLLTSLTYQPLEKPIRNDKAIDLKNGVISISGKSTDEDQFTTWLRSMESLSFTKNVTITKYGLDNKTTSGFELILNIKTDGTAD